MNFLSFFQLILEKQKLFAMQLHLRLFEHKHSDSVCPLFTFTSASVASATVTLSRLITTLTVSLSDFCLEQAASDWPYSLPLFLPQQPLADGGVGQQWGIKHLEELSQHGHRAAASAQLLTGNMALGPLKATKEQSVTVPPLHFQKKQSLTKNWEMCLEA